MLLQDSQLNIFIRPRRQRRADRPLNPALRPMRRIASLKRLAVTFRRRGRLPC